MTSDFTMNQRASILEEIRLIVVEALRNDDIIHPKALAAIVARSYPGSDLTEEQIAASIFEAAAEASIRVTPPHADLLQTSSKPQA